MCLFQHVINKLDFFVVGVPLKASYDKYTQQSVHGYLNEREYHVDKSSM